MAAVDMVDSSGRPAIMHLQDGTTAEPLGLYLHTSLLRLCEGPDALLKGRRTVSSGHDAVSDLLSVAEKLLLRAPVAGGCRLRIGNCQVRRALKSAGLPPRLLPTEEVAIVCSTVQHAVQVLKPLQIVSPEAYVIVRLLFCIGLAFTAQQWCSSLTCVRMQVHALVDPEFGAGPCNEAVHGVVQSVWLPDSRSGMPTAPSLCHICCCHSVRHFCASTRYEMGWS